MTVLLFNCQMNARSYRTEIKMDNISAEDWARDQKTLFVLQNSSLMQQILASTQTHATKSGYTPSDEETQKILGV